MLLERALDLEGVHGVAAVLDHVLLAAGEHDRAEHALAGEVARAQPTVVGERRLGRRGVAPVALRHARAAEQQLADLARADLVAVVVDDLELVAGHRKPERLAEPDVEHRRRRLERGTASRLDHPVALEEQRLADPGRRTEGSRSRRGP